ncbi:FecR family protein [Pseudothauera nasutitermitis]|nr:FecR domain-containing protein [Pseudothauera nasutitermitis]
MDTPSSRIAEQATEYFSRRRAESPQQRRQREAWLAADPRHAAEYAKIQRLWDLAGELRDAPRLQALRGPDMASLRRSRWPGWASAAAVTVGLLFGGVFMASRYAPPEAVIYATALGERRTETLADGTVAVLNTDTALAVRYSRRRRDVELRHGEAQFDVARDAAKPFVVHLGDSTVTAIGTRFQVRRDADAAAVTLLEGKVEVAHGQERHALQPNERALLTANAGILVQPVDLEQANGWVDGWLRFRNAPLSQVVAEANRYSDRKLRLGDPSLADIPLSGNFRAGQSASIATSVQLILPVRVDDSGADIVLLPE